MLPENIGDLGDDITRVDLGNMGLVGKYVRPFLLLVA
jgi:hypothetical protein